MPISVDYPFQIMGVDIMELPLTTKGNKYLIVFQDLFTNDPWHFPHQIKRPSKFPDY